MRFPGGLAFLIAVSAAGQTPTPPAPARPEPPPVATEPQETPPTVSGPRNTVQKSASRVPAVTGKAAAPSTGSALTVKAFQTGKKITLLRPSGLEVTYRLASDAALPEGLAPGRTVTVETRIRNGRRTVTRVAYAPLSP